MRYAIYHRGDDLSVQLTRTFQHLAEKKGLLADPNNPEVVISIGGDGTMLQSIHRHEDGLENTHFVGIHTGRLGFYADWKPEELEPLIESMIEKKFESVEYPLLCVEVHTSKYEASFVALNEVTIKSLEGTIVLQVDINHKKFETFRGDGLCISTPSGSTAYNKSLGGCIIHPSLEVMQIAEIASINNRVYRTLGSSFILPKHHHCQIFSQLVQPIQLTIDLTILNVEQLHHITCKMSDRRVKFARYKKFPFWDRVREAFIEP